MHKIFNKIIKFSIYTLVVLIPLFFLPWTGEFFEFNKQYLLFFLVSLAFIAWLTKLIFIEKRLFFIRTPLDLWVLLFALIMVLSAIFSVDKISSWIGFYGRFSTAVIPLLILCVMYFVITNNMMETGKDNSAIGSLVLDKLINLFIISGFIVMATAYMTIFGVWKMIPGLPDMMKLSAFNPVSGSFEGLSIFLVSFISLLTGLFLASIKKDYKIKKFNLIRNKPVYLLFMAVALVLLLIVDFRAAWIVLGVTMILLLAMAFWTRLFREKVNVLLVPIVLLIVVGVGLTFNTQTFFVEMPIWGVEETGNNFQLPQEIILDYRTTGSIVWQTLKDYPILGSGPETFFTDFAKHKPVEFNENRFWNIRFDRAPSHLLEMVATTGILGTVSYLLLIVVFLLIGTILFSKKRLDNLISKKLAYHPICVFPVLLTWLSLFTAQFFYSQNTTLKFSFWLFTALTIIVWQKAQGKASKKVSLSFEKIPEVGLVMSVILLILIFALIGLFYFSGRFYLADMEFTHLTNDSEILLSASEKAVLYNKYRENYRRALSKIYLVSAWEEARKPEEERDLNMLQAYAAGAVRQARDATILNSNSVGAWEDLGAIYNDARGLIGGTLPLAKDAYKRAIDLEPTNPFLYREICSLSIISGDEDWDNVVNYCQKAIDLKPNYLDAHIQLALVYEQKGDLERAKAKLSETLEKLKGVSFERDSDLAIIASEVYFQLGRVNFNLNNLDEALGMFEQAVIIMPQYSNARYALALTYQQKGRKKDALAQFKILDQLIPGNENIEKMIKELERPVQAPVQAAE